ncbi:MAG: hypothetical protein LHV68_00505 [Elusimicrobia bacterium]|nr:hypothetical protein [Candidatus Liberimonas magnetica]
MTRKKCTVNKICEADIPLKIRTLLGSSWDKVKNLAYARSNHRLTEEIDKNISEIVNKINSLEISGKKTKTKDIKFGKVGDLDKFTDSPAYKYYKTLAEQYLLKGKYVPQFLFAGGATRFGLGTMWGVNLAVIGDVISGKRKEALKYISKKHLEAHINKLKPLTYEELNLAIDKLKKYRAKIKPIHIGMGARQLLQYRVKLETLSKKHGKAVSGVLEKTSLILNLNSDVAKEVKHDLLTNNFYGFNPDRVFILIQPTYKAAIIKNNKLVIDNNSEPLPFGHGHATMQIIYDNEAVKIDRAGQESLIKKSVIGELLNSGCAVLGTHRINDMTKWTAEVLAVEKLAYGIYQINEKNKEVVLELVENPKNQKGGHWLRVKNKEFLCDTISTNTPELKGFLASFNNTPYNAFRNMYSIKSLSEKLTDSYGIKFNLRYVDGGFYLESVSGDITLAMNSMAFQKKGEIIHDIKSIKDYALEGIDFAAWQENDPCFIKLAQNLR